METATKKLSVIWSETQSLNSLPHTPEMHSFALLYDDDEKKYQM